MKKVILTVLAIAVIGGGAFGVYKYVSNKTPATPEAALMKKLDSIKPGTIVAKINNQVVTIDELKEFAKTVPAQYQQLPIEVLYPQLVQQLVITKLIDEKATSLNMANDPEVLQKIEQAKKQIVESVYVQREVAKRVNDTKIKEAYQTFLKENPQEEEVHARHILVDSEEKAKEVIAKLNEKSGKNFEELAKEMSIDSTSGQNGGDLGYFTRTEMIPEFSDAAFAMNKGSYSTTPIKSSFGWHIIKVEDKRKRPQPSLDDVKPQLAAKVSRDAYMDFVSTLQKSSNVEYFDMEGKPMLKDEEPAQSAPKSPAPADESKAPAEAPKTP